MARLSTFLIATIAFLLVTPRSADAQLERESPVPINREVPAAAENNAESKQMAQDREADRKSRKEHDKAETRNAGVVMVLFGAFCALWAQNTGRNAWLWFFLGAVFNVFTVFFLLTKNANDNFEKRRFGRSSLDPPSTK